MCLILLAYRVHPAAEVILAGNRDEFYARPTAPPAQIAVAPRIWAGRDLEAGGTWMGRNEHGLLAALTNLRSAAEPPPEAHSRGAIVRALLEHATPADAARWLKGLDVARYRPFNVLFGNGARFYYAASQEGAQPRELAPGYHALSNSSLDDASWPKVARALGFLRRAHGLEGEALLLAVQAFLCDPTQPDGNGAGAPEPRGALGAVFVQTADYGTVSASVLTSGGRLGERYYYAGAAAMRAAQAGWARRLVIPGASAAAPDLAAGNGVVPPPPEGSPFRRVVFGG
jgi:uncharacterized protein with NRDE domain